MLLPVSVFREQVANWSAVRVETGKKILFIDCFDLFISVIVFGHFYL